VNYFSLCRDSYLYLPVSVGLSIPCVNVLGAAGGESLRKIREYWLFALWCALVLGLAEWPRRHYESAALTAEL
jgi:hypothetical protein